MPTYGTVTAVFSHAPHIGSVSAITSAVVASVMDYVEAEINGRIAKRYSLPLSVSCPILAAISVRETIYRLSVQRQLIHFPPAQQGRHPLMQQHLDDLKLLDEIANGVVVLVDSSGSQVLADTSQIEFWHNMISYTPTMDEGPVESQIIDPDLLDDIQNDKR